SALRILYLQDDVADRMLEMIEGAAAELNVGDPRQPATDLGPVIDAEAKANLDRHIALMRKSETVRFEGRAPNAGSYVAPVIIELREAATLDREVFGPILHVVRWKAGDLDKVIEQVAATGYGLTLGIHSRIDETVDAIVEKLAVGNVYVNRNVIGAVVGTQPFGGSGLSGTGPKAGGPNYLLRFAEEQVISVNTAAAGGNASLMAMGDG
ncbi:MAG TPA: aldehyde dehydrogenase family protein, partial [Kaistia sp.]|nr:aldehyde dehydrogenase family protein [Kaistia sp.]